MYQQYILNGYDQITFSAGEVQNAICKVHLKKAGGLDELSGNYLKFAFDILHRHVVNLFIQNCLCIKHASVPNSFTTNLIVPSLQKPNFR